MEIKKDYTDNQEQLARFAKALAHPARIAILQFLASQQTCYFGDIHEELPIAKATVSQHKHGSKPESCSACFSKKPSANQADAAIINPIPIHENLS